MKVDLDQILALAGDLSDEGNRDRFRRFLLASAKDPDAIMELLASAVLVSDLEHEIAVQDLVLSLGIPLGFEPGPSFGGHWKSPSGVIFILKPVAGDEPLDIAALVGRRESLPRTSAAASTAGEGTGEAEAAEKEGLKVDEDGRALDEEELSVLVLLVAKDSETLRVEEAILEEDESGQVRTISTSALLALTKMAREYRLTHGDVLLLLLASAPSVDPIIDLLTRVVSRCEAETPTLEEIAQILGPSGRGGEAGPGEALQDLIDQSRYYAFGSRGAGRRETRR